MRIVMPVTGAPSVYMSWASVSSGPPWAIIGHSVMP